MVLAGNKDQRAWGIGLAGQVLWAIWIVSAGAWGLMPSCLALTYVYARNYWKWGKP